MRHFLMILLAISSVIIDSKRTAPVRKQFRTCPVLSQAERNSFSERKKSKGYEAILAKMTSVAAVLFVVLAVALVMIE